MSSSHDVQRGNDGGGRDADRPPSLPIHGDGQTRNRSRSDSQAGSSSGYKRMCEPIEGWEELDRNKLGCEYDRPSEFVVSQWPLVPWPIFIFYRLMFAAYTVAVFVLVLVQSDWSHAAFWWAYYMHWSHAMLMLSAIAALAVGISARIKVKGQTSTPVDTNGSDDDLTKRSQTSTTETDTSKRPPRKPSEDERLPLKGTTDDRTAMARRIDAAYEYKLDWSLKLFWFLRNVAYNQSLVTSFFFWTLLYDYMRHTPGLLAVNQSVIDALLVIADCIVSSAPIQFLHAWQPIIFAVAYVLLSIIFSIVGNEAPAKPYFFKVLDYKQHPVLSAFVIIFLVTVMIPTAQFFLVCLANLRKYFYQCMRESKHCSCAGCQKQYATPPATTPKPMSK